MNDTTIESNTKNRSKSIGKLAGALAKAQKVMGNAHKDKANPFFKSKYADLASVWDACRDPLSDNGIAVVQSTDECEPGSVCIVTLLLHESDQWIEGRLTLRPTKADPQGMGSAITYGRRYALAAMVGVSPDDDDGQKASRKVETKVIQPTPVEAKALPKSTTPPITATIIEANPICNMGKNAGTPWKELAPNQLRWYKKKLSDLIVDRTQDEFRDANQAAFNGVKEALDSVEVQSA
jgi:hypothetical protein